jgi:hypothetical protein
MRRTYCTLNDCKMQHNAEVGLFTKPSPLIQQFSHVITIFLTFTLSSFYFRLFLYFPNIIKEKLGC